ncbi:hypothetical protein ACJX0J_005386, partial [Zea mays]
YAFIPFEDEFDAEDAIRRLDNQVEPVPKSRGRPTGDVKATRTLFVINFDPIHTNIRVQRNFAFVQYETQEEANAAIKSTDKSTILDRVVTVEYAFWDDDGERDD